MPVLIVPVAQVQAHRHVVGYAFYATSKTRYDLIESLARYLVERSLENANLYGHVPLHGDLIVRQARQQRAQVGKESTLIRGLQKRLILGVDPGIDRRQWGGVLHLESQPAGITPSFCRREKMPNDSAYASA